MYEILFMDDTYFNASRATIVWEVLFVVLLVTVLFLKYMVLSISIDLFI